MIVEIFFQLLIVDNNMDRKPSVVEHDVAGLRWGPAKTQILKLKCFASRVQSDGDDMADVEERKDGRRVVRWGSGQMEGKGANEVNQVEPRKVAKSSEATQNDCTAIALREGRT